MVTALLVSVIANYHVMKQVTLMDKSGFEKPVPAATMLIPKDWTFDNTIVWQKPGGCSGLFISTFKATSPDGKTGVEGLPIYGWQWSDNPDMRSIQQGQNQQNAQMGFATCDVMQPMDAASFLRFAVPRIRNNAQVVAVDAIPGVREATQRQVQQQQQQTDQFGMNIRWAIDDARAKISYTSAGSKVDEWITVLVSSQVHTMQMIGASATSFSFQATQAYGLKAPAGQLAANENLYKLIIGSIRLDPQWLARVNQVQQNINQTNAKGMADRAKIRADANAYTSNLINEGYDKQQASQDRQHAQFSQYIREVDTYEDPGSGKSVELPAFYGHAWSNGQGDYVVSDTASFNPNETLKGSWSALQKVR